MASLLCLALMLAMIGASDAAGWCVCRSDVSDSALQKAIDYACGAGADCTPIQQGGACYNPNTVRAHCSYAANSYYQRKGQTQQACDFSGAASLSSTDPSANGCTYPASSSAAGSSSSTNNSPTGTNTPGSSTTIGGGSTTPSTTTPNTGTGIGGGGIGGGLGGFGPSGSTISSTDTNNGGILQSSKALVASLLVLSLSLLLMLKA